MPSDTDRGRAMTHRVRFLLAVFGVSVAISLGLASTASAAPGYTTVTGTWGLHTNDCFFGQCDYRLHLVQRGTKITGGAGSGISRSVSGTHITVNYTGVSSEDDWGCRGTLNAARTRFHGTFQDGTGGSGLCNAWRIVT